MPINTLYQLFAARRQTPKILEAARYLVTIPDLFHYWLTGNAVCEFTNATTTQMVDPVKRTWATALMQRLELPAELPAPLVEPGSIVGTLLPEVAGHSSLADTTVIAPACHDTGSAVAAISARDGTAFLSSGTWSLLGTELDSPVITPEALRMNFTNEGGVNGTTRLLKNVMGLWMLEGCRQSWTAQGRSYDYGESVSYTHLSHAELSSGQRLLIEYKPFEPAFYHTDIADWGMALLLARAAGPQAKVLVDTGHHYACLLYTSRCV